MVFVFAAICLLAALTRAQENYEIQVYGSETIPRGVTMIELHNNFTAKGSKTTDDGTLPTNHAWHETIEITHGFNDWFETGFYIFTSARNGSECVAKVGVRFWRWHRPDSKYRSPHPEDDHWPPLYFWPQAQQRWRFLSRVRTDSVAAFVIYSAGKTKDT